MPNKFLLSFFFSTLLTAAAFSVSNAVSASKPAGTAVRVAETTGSSKVTIKEQQDEDNAEPLYEGQKQDETAIPEPKAPAAPYEITSTAKKNTTAESMVVSRDWTIDGVIVGEKDKKLMIAAGDTIYVNLGKDKVKNGDLCQVFRKVGKVKDPNEYGGSLGFEVRRIGKIQITGDTGDNVSTAKVIVSYEPLLIGDAVKIIPSEE